MIDKDFLLSKNTIRYTDLAQFAVARRWEDPELALRETLAWVELPRTLEVEVSIMTTLLRLESASRCRKSAISAKCIDYIEDVLIPYIQPNSRLIEILPDGGIIENIIGPCITATLIGNVNGDAGSWFMRLVVEPAHYVERLLRYADNERITSNG